MQQKPLDLLDDDDRKELERLLFTLQYVLFHGSPL